MIRRSHKKSRQGCAECKRSHKRVRLIPLHIDLYLYRINRESLVLISIIPSVTRTVHQVASTVKGPRGNVALLEMEPVKVLAREILLCILAQKMRLDLQVHVRLSFLRLPN